MEHPLENGHLTPDTISNYARGSHPLQDTELIVDHLSHCQQCRSAFVAAMQSNRDLYPSQTTTKLPLPPPQSDSFDLLGYHDVELLGKGGMGAIYSAVQQGTQRKVAIKFIREQFEDDSPATDRARRALREARALAQLSHPNIVAVLEVLIVRQLPALVMEHVSGIPLDSWIQINHPSPIQAAKIVLQLTDAIHHAHQRGVLHCDLKPQNVLVETPSSILPSPPPSPKLIDFGLAKLQQEDVRITHPGDVLGTPAYMPPEKASGDTTESSEAIDIYGLGTILYELLTHRPPFIAADRRTLLAQLITAPPTPPRQINPSIPIDLETICLKCLEKKPADRYQSAESLAHDIQAVLHDEPITTRRPNHWKRIQKWTKRNRVSTTLLLTFLAFGLAGFLTILYQAASNEALVTQKSAEKEERLAAQRRAEQAENTLIDELRTSLQEMSQRAYGSPPSKSSEERQVILGIAKRWNDISENIGDDIKGQALRAEALMRIGISHSILGDKKTSDEKLCKGIELFKQLINVSPTPENRLLLAENHLQLAILKFEESDLNSATEQFQNALIQFKNVPQSFLDSNEKPLEIKLRTHLDFVNLLTLQHQFTQATEQLEAAGQLLATQNVPLNDSHDFGTLECRYFNATASLLQAQGKNDEAIQALEQSLLKVEKLIADPESKNEALQLYVRHQTLLGRCFKDRGQFEQALEPIVNAIAIQRRLQALLPSIPILRHQLGANLNFLAFIEAQRGAMNYAVEAGKEALEIHNQLLIEQPNNPVFRFEQASVLNNLVAVYLALSQWEKANAFAPQLLEARRSLYTSQPERIEFIHGLAATLNIVGTLLDKTNQSQQAIALFDEAQQLYEKLLQRSPTTQAFRSGLAKTQLLRADSALQAKQWQDAVNIYSQALEMFHKQPPEAIIADKRFIKQCYFGQATAYEALGDQKAMQSCLDLANSPEN